MKRFEAWLPMLPVAALVAVALTQIGMTWPEDSLVSPAKGGGFGMFSTVDRLENRHVFVFAVRGDQVTRLRLGGSRLGERVRSNPTEENLRALGRSLVGKVPAQSFRVEVWKQSWSSDTRRARRVLLARTTVPADGR